MSVKKVLSYGRFSLTLCLALYLVLVWLYFKDNAQQLTPAGLLLWFVIVPLLLLGSILTLLWWQKKQEKNENNRSDSDVNTSNEDNETTMPETHPLFVYSRVCLPEGNCWSEVIDNNEDLTVLSEELTDAYGLPLLIKPIARLTEAAFLPEVYGSSLDWDDETFEEEATHTQHLASPNSTTLRLYALVHELLNLSDDILSNLAQHVYQYHSEDKEQSNSAINVHPEWQQHYLVGASEQNTDETLSTTHSLPPKLSIYLCLPSSADAPFLTTAVKNQLTEYLIPETAFSITSIVTDDDSRAVDGTPTCNITAFIHEHVMTLSQSDDPELCLVLVADSQINEGWLDDHPITRHDTTAVPTEAGTLLIFFNHAAQNVIDIDDKASVLLTEFGTSNDQNEESNNRHYLRHLTAIKNLLIRNAMSLSSTNSAEKNEIKKPSAKQTDTKNKTNVSLKDMSITATSDINPLIQSYDMSVYLNFLESFIAQEALVKEQHLGHYMPLNSWLKAFISVSLFVDLANDSKQELEKTFLITQHKKSALLWLADVSDS
ncbi:hypothetical protein [Psychrobacter alimentarius]|uniref:hypothetical protein n=1 Tax=Psychrobacter alimentarius TaxID=261164 RepID=UPI00191A5A34|nr:hypothetical protein [Psychrobacter alimentarius]